MELVALKVQIIKQGSNHVYPNFDKIASAKRGNLKWVNYIDQFGGWLYDQCCGFNETDDESPDEGVKIGVFLVPQAFAAEAEELFPERVTVINEAALEHFYDNRAMILVPGEKIVPEIVSGLRAKYGQPTGPLDTSVMTAEEQEMLDPESPRPGIVRNKKRRFADVKEARNLIIQTLD